MAGFSDVLFEAGEMKAKARRPEIPGVCGGMQDHYIVGTVGKASTELLLLKQCTFLDMNGIADGQHPCYDKWHDGIGGLFKGGYTTNGIGFGYFRNS
ncbi:hypothetical protein C8034_v000971 [Colletotrichum sidae]|uniref:Uncharacterized protein n=1 Tax=Colletotrichum sidae TaxID=1347389 RepID=A0A4R8SX98_9PEZI|nr:hypothetical protein C8034_v000971 [Colletotrichum sidae]